MSTLLAIGVSPRYDYSTSRKLTALFVEKWWAAHPGGQVKGRPARTWRWRWKTVCWAPGPQLKTVRKSVWPSSFTSLEARGKRPPIRAASAGWSGGAFTPPDQHSPESAAAIKVSNHLVAELQSADHIVIGTPMYNFSIPAVLKAYIDHVVRKGLTVSTDNVGMLTGKKATVILATGGDFSPGSPVEGYNLASGYLRQVLGFIGITDVEIILAGGPRAGAYGEAAVEQFGDAVELAAAA